jgi:hypothetical protein
MGSSQYNHLALLIHFNLSYTNFQWFSSADYVARLSVPASITTRPIVGFVVAIFTSGRSKRSYQHPHVILTRNSKFLSGTTNGFGRSFGVHLHAFDHGIGQSEFFDHA